MFGLSQLEIMLILYMIVVNIFALIALIISSLSNRKIGEVFVITAFTIAAPIFLPFTLSLIIHTIKENQMRKKLMNQNIKKEGEENE